MDRLRRISSFVFKAALRFVLVLHLLMRSDAYYVSSCEFNELDPQGRAETLVC